MAIAALLAAGLVVADASAQFTPGSPGQRAQLTAEQLVDVRVIADRTHVGPGETFHVVALFDISRRWHLYWKNPGEAGAFPPSVSLTVPDGFSVGEVRWPRPKRLNSPAGEMFCYENQLALFIPVTAPVELAEGEVAVDAAIRYAVCDANRCLLGQTTKRQTIQATTSHQTGGPANGLSAGDAALLERHLKRLPRQIGDTDNASIFVQNETLIITVPAHGMEQATFFPLDSPGVEYGQPETAFADDQLVVSIALTINPNNFRGGHPSVGGLVALGREPDGPSYEGQLPLSP
jgi:DsbC/DsbD-like thiol-disulfide interchange protein